MQFTMIFQGSKDNLSVMILNFDASNIKPEDDKISHDEELDNRIRELTKGKNL